MLALALLGAAFAFTVSVSEAGAYVYWTNHGPFIGGTGTTVGRGNLDGSGVNESFITGASQLGGMVVDASHIYWGNGTSIGRANLDGSDANPHFIATGSSAVVDIATDGTSLWWTDGGEYVGRANIDGSGTPNPHCIDAGSLSLPAGIAVASGIIYLGEPNEIADVGATCGTTPTALATITPTLVVPPFGLALNNGYVYFTAGSEIDRVQATGGTPHSYVTGLGAPTGLAFDANYIYWADNQLQNEEIGRAPLSNPSGPQLDFTSDSAGPLGIAVDGGIDPTNTSVSCTPSSVSPNSTTACKATVTDSASSSAPSGTVVFSGNATTAFIGGSSSCTLTPAASGGMSCVVGAVPTVAGTAQITATYQGDGAHAQSQGSANVCAGTSTQCGPSSGGTGKCVVPKVHGKSLATAERLIRRAGCAIGKIKKPKPLPGQRLGMLVVRRTTPGAGATVAKGTKLAIRLVQKPKA